MAAPNPTQGPLPLLLAVLYCFCWLIRGYPRKYICVLLANFLLTYTGYAFFFGFITPVLLALDYRRNSRHPASKYRWWSAAAFAISLASLASFFVGYKLDPGFGCFSLVPKNPAGYLQFMAIMFAHVGGFRISNLTFAMLVGLIVLLSLVSGISLSVRRLWAFGSETYPHDAAIVALLAYTAIFCLSTAYGRLCLGVQYGTTSRYTEWLALGFLGLYFFALSLRSRTWRASLTLVLLLLSLHGAKRLNRIDAGGLEAISNGKRAWRECYLARHSIQECTTLTHFQIFFPETTRRQEKLDFLEHNRLNLYDGSQ